MSETLIHKATLPTLGSDILLEASMVLARCRTQAQIMGCIERTVARLGGVTDYDVIWLASGVERSLRLDAPQLPVPGLDTRLRMADGQIAVEHGIAFVPLVARGLLQGWIAVRSDEPLEPALAAWAAHCASALTSVDVAAITRGPDRERVLIDAIAHVVSSTLDLDLLLERIGALVRELIDARGFYVALIDRESHTFGFAYMHLPAGALRPDAEWPVDQGLTGVVARTGEPLCTDDYLGECRRRGIAPQGPADLGYATGWLGVPLRHQDQTLGVMVVTQDAPGVHFEASDVQLLTVVAAQAAAAVANARLYGQTDEALRIHIDDLEQTVDRLTALNALSLTISTNQLTADEIINMAIAGAVGTTGGEGGGAAIAVDGQPTAVYRSGDPALAVDPDWLVRLVPATREYVELTGGEIPHTLREGGIQHMLVVPLRGANLAVGALWIGYAQAAIAKAERETAVLYAKMTGAVLENLYLAEAVRSAHDRMASILLSTREGMLLAGADGRISITNRAFSDLLGVEQAQLQGHNIQAICEGNVLDSLPAAIRARICAALGKAVAGATEVTAGQLTIAGATERHLTWHVLPVHAAAGENTGALLVVRDVTADHQMERLRQDLANMIVHDLRAPLTNMLVSVDLLLKPGPEPLNERQRRILNIASNSCHQMLDLVNALLDIRRLEKQTVELHRRPSYLSGIAAGVLEFLERIAEDKVIRVAVDLDRLPAVEADTEMIRRVLQNLVDNALKFSPPQSTVQITGAIAGVADLPPGHPPGRWVIVDVRDQGTGVPEVYQQVIFELFVQAPDGHGQGTGLGLAFCKLAVEAHGGRIWVESRPGQGATFRFTLPMARQ